MARYNDSISLQYKGRDIDDIVESMSESAPVPTKAVKTLGKRKRIKGFKTGTPDPELSLKVHATDDPGYPDFWAMRDSGEIFGLVKRPRFGKSVSFIHCIVTNVAESHTDGDDMLDVSVRYAERK